MAAPSRNAKFVVRVSDWLQSIPGRPFRTLLARTLAIPILAIMAAVAVLIWQFQNSASDAGWIDHTDRVIATAEQAETRLVTAQSALVAFLLTGREIDLGSFNAAFASFSQQLTKLRTMSADNPSQTRRLDDLRALAAQWKKSADSEVQLKLKGGDARVLIQEDAAHNLMDSLRATFDSFLDAEYQLRISRTARSIRSSRELLLGTLIFAPALGLALGLLGLGEIRSTSAIYAAALAEAERASQAKDEFLAMISHELRNPLNSIALSSYAFHRLGEGDERLTRSLATIDRSVRLLSTMIDDLVDSTRMASGNLTFDRQRIDLVAAVRSAIDIMIPIATAKRIELAPRLAPSPITVEADAQRVVECLTNIISNAIKFTPSDGRIDLAVAQVGQQVEVRIEDTGEGIEREFLDHVFDRFAQAKTSRDRKGGLGLGLSIVKYIIEMHGGTVRAESEGKGRGATFIITLPVAADSSAKLSN